MATKNQTKKEFRMYTRNYKVNDKDSQVKNSKFAKIYYAILPLLLKGEITRRHENNKRLKLLAKFHMFAQITRARRRAYQLDIDPSEIPSWSITTIKNWLTWFIDFNKPEFAHRSAGAMATHVNENNSQVNFYHWCENNRITIEHDLINAGINWLNQQPLSKNASIPSQLTLDGQYHYIDKQKTCGYKGRLTATSKGYPSLKLLFNSFKNGGYSDYFNSYDALSELYQNSVNGTPCPSFSTSTPPPKKNYKKTVANEQQTELAKANNVKKEIADFFNTKIFSPDPSGDQNWYLDENKNIAGLIDSISESGLDDVDIRYSTNDKFGDHAAILLKDIFGNQRGLQRFHKKLFHEKNKSFTWGLKKNGAFFQIGKITDKTEAIAFCEGLANAIILAAFLQIPVVACLDSGNLKHVISDFAKNYPNLKGFVFADNDQWKYDRSDNAGILKAVEACREANAIIGKDNYRFIVPEFNNDQLKHEPTDVYDLWKLNNGKVYFEALLKNAQKPLDGYDWHLFKLNYVGLRTKQDRPLIPFSKTLTGLIESGIELTPQKPFSYIRNEVLSAIKKQSKRFSGIKCYKESEMIAYTEKRLKASYAKSIEESIKIISDKTLMAHEKNGGKVVRFDLVLNKNGHYEIPTSIANQILNADDGLHVLSAPKAGGKTSKVIKPSVDRATKEMDFPIGFSPYILLSHDLSEKMLMGNYQAVNTAKEAQKQDSLVLCINSALKGVYQGIIGQSRFTFVDEIDAVYDAITVGTVPDFLRKPIFDRLQEMLGSNKALVASADIDDLCLSFLLKTRPANEIIIYIANSTMLKGKKYYLHDDHNHLKQISQNATTNGEKTFISGDNVPFIESIGKRFEQSGINHKTITSNNSKSKDSQGFVEKINDSVKTVQSLCCTTVLATGVSIECDHFDSGYAVFNGEASIDTFSQLLARPRALNEYHIAFAKNIDRVNVEKAIEDATKEIMASALKTKSIVDNDGYKIGLDTIEFSDFDIARIATIERKKDERNANVFLRRLLALGAEIEYVFHDKEAKKESAIKSKQEIADLKQSKVDEILEADKLLEPLSKREVTEMAEKAMDKAVTTTQEKAAIMRTKYRQKTTEPLIKFEQNGGGAKITRLEKALLEKKGRQSVELDAKELENLPPTLLKHNRVRQTFDNLLLNAIELEFNDDFTIAKIGKPFTGKDSRIKELVGKVLRHKDVFNGAGMGVKITDKTSGRMTNFIRNWSDALGIKLINERQSEGKRDRIYFVDSEWLNTILKPIQSRHADGVNKFCVEIAKYEKDEIPLEVYADEITPEFISEPGSSEPLVNKPLEEKNDDFLAVHLDPYIYIYDGPNGQNWDQNLFSECFTHDDIANVIDHFEDAPEHVVEKVVGLARERAMVLRAADILP